MNGRPVGLPHNAEVHKVTAYWHPSLGLWSASPGEEYTFDVYGVYSRRSGEVVWQTDLIQLDEGELEWQDKRTSRSLVAAITWALKRFTLHKYPNRRGSPEELHPHEIIVRLPSVDVLSSDATDK
jgi:hypothetical protein